MNTKSEIEQNKNRCIHCGACYKTCPMMDSFGTSPKVLLERIHKEASFAEEVAYACMLCNACTEACPKNIDLKNMFHHIRINSYALNQKRYKAKKNKSFHLKKVEYYQKNSFRNLFSKTTIDKKAKRLFIPGCSLASYSPSVIKNIWNYLKEHFNDIDLVIRCCAKPSSDIGDIKSFNVQMNKMKELIEHNGIEEVIIACESCYVTYRDQLEGVQVKSLYEVIHEVGIPKHLRNHYISHKIYALHDPCAIKSQTGIHLSVRAILKDLGITIKEFPKNRENTACCGSGGMVKETNQKIWRKQAMFRAGATDIPRIISYCESCVSSLAIEGKDTLHILDFLFNEEVIEFKRECQKSTNFLASWTNKYRSAHYIK